ncbi:MAG: hypothetical protein ACWGOL_00065 [Desulfuromonadales bacterium]
MRRGWIYLLLLLVALISMGMGGLGGNPEGTVPKTDVNIQAELKDHGGTVTSLSQFSMDGKTFLEAWKGQGRLTIPFLQIETVSFGETKGDEVKIVARLKSGDVVPLTIRSGAQFYGSTGFGAFRIRSRDVASIVFP